MTDDKDRRSGAIRTHSRRTFVRLAVGASGLVALNACAPTAPTTAPAKLTEAPRPTATSVPVAQPAATAAPAAKAPVSLKGTTLTVLQASNFIPEADPFFKKQIEEGFMKDTGAQVNIEFIGNNELTPKIAAAIQSGSGPDVVQAGHNWAHVYKESLVDVSDVAEQVKRVTGEFFPGLDAYTRVDGRYLAVPHDYLGQAILWRKSWFKEVGAERFPATYDEYHEVGKRLKAKGHPLGQSLGHSIGDPVFWTYPMMWAYGGQEVDEQGRVAINSPGTIAAVRAMKEAWPAAYDETGMAWDDAGNNRAFLAETISATYNGASIWWVARKDKAPFFDDIGMDLMPAGPRGSFGQGLLWSYGIMRYSKSVDAAKEFVKWSMTDDVWMPWFEVGGSYFAGVGARQNDNPIWEKFPPVTRILKDTPATFRGLGWPGPPDQKVGLVQARYIIVDMFARAVQGESPEAAVAWAEGEMKQVYGG